MPAQKSDSLYLIFTKEQSKNFLKKITEIVEKILAKNGKKDKINRFTDKKEKYKFFVDEINKTKKPTNNYYFTNIAIFEQLSRANPPEFVAIPFEKNKNFFNDYFSGYDFGADTQNIGRLEMTTLEKVRKRNESIKEPHQDKKTETSEIGNENNEFDEAFMKGKIEEHEYALYSYGERYINSEGGNSKPRLIFYLKERPTLFKNGEIFLKNTDDIGIVFHPEHRSRKGIKVIQNSKQYQGSYQVFERKNKGGKSMIYLETSAMVGRNNRHFKIMLSFGEGIGEIAIGTFTSIKDSGTLLAGAALLVRKEKGFFQDHDCKIYTTFKDNPLHISIRMLLEKRLRTYVKLPKQLEKYSIDGLNENLIEQKGFERDELESREPTIHRKDVFVSIPLRCNGNSKYKNNVDLLDTFINILKQKPFGLTKITYGIIKHKTTPANQLPSSKDEYESNFDKIIQSNFVAFLFPPITFPYEEKGIKAQLNQEITKISTSFIELGYALGLRKKILILTSEKVNKVLPSVVGEFVKGSNILIIECDFSNPRKFEESVTIHEREIGKFIDKHIDYEVVGN